MKRYHIYALVLMLLAVLPTSVAAQSVTRMEYWFDGNVDDMQWTSVSEGGNTEELNTDGLSVGMHTLYYRFRHSGTDIYGDSYRIDMETEEVSHERTYYGELLHSPVYSSRFFKHAPSQGNTVEYWFDNNSKSTTTITGDENETVSLDLSNITQFPMGFHQLNMRFSTTGKSPSAIYTADVMKFSAGSRYLEYWVDDKYADRQRIEGTLKEVTTDDVKKQFLIINTEELPLTNVAPGLHRLYFRTSNSEGIAGSAVYSTLVFRHAAEASQIEYWFDNDASTVTKKQFATQYQNGTPYTIDLNSDVFPQGLHMLNIRVSTKDGSLSHIYSTPVVKMSSGSFSKLQCWLDDDMEHTLYLNGTQSSNGDMVFSGNLDFDFADPGMHYLHYRAVGTDGKPSNAVGQWPVMVKSRYSADPSEARVTGYSFSVDNGSAIVKLLPNETRNRTIDAVLDTRNLSQGTHTLHAKVYNSFGTLAGEDAQFVVTALPEPKLTLVATADENGVHLTANSLANDVSYTLHRGKVGYTIYDICGMKETYPLSLSHVDHPAAGNYVYYLDGTYIDRYGKKKTLKSNEVTISVPEPQNAITYGSITGEIRRPGHSVWGNFDIYVEMNLNNGEDIRRSHRTGDMYYFDQVPEGAQVTLSVKGDRYATYEDKTFTVDYDTYAGNPYARQRVNFEGTLNEEAGEVSGNYDYALKLASDISWDHNKIKFDVKSLYLNSSWSGDVYAYAIEKSVADKNNVDVSNLPGALKSIRLESEGSLNFNDGKNHAVSIPLTKIGKLRKDKEYYFAFYTNGQFTSDFYNSIKPLALDDGIANENGYIVHTLEKKDYGSEESIREDDASKLANMLVKLSCKVNGMDGHIGDLSSYYDVVREAASSIGSTREYEDFDKLVDYMGRTNPIDLLNNPNLSLLFTGVDYSAPLASIVVNKLTPFCKTATGFTSVLTLLKDINNTVTGSDFYEKFFSCAHAIFYLGGKYASNSMLGPLCTEICTYVDIGTSLAQAARQLGEAYYEKYEVSYWKENGEMSNDPAHNAHMDFKIKIKKGRKTIDFSDYSEQELHQMIDYAKVHFSTFKTTGLVGTHDISTRMVGVKDGIMLKQTGITSSAALDDNHTVGRMWLEIKWANGRTSLIPLMKESKFGVDHEVIHNRYTYTVNYKSESKDLKHIADEIHLND